MVTVQHTSLPDKGTQCWELLQAFLRGERLTVLTAIDKYRCYALSQRCGELRNTYGWPILGEWVTLPSGKRIKGYSL